MAVSPLWTHPYVTGTNVNAFRDYSVADIDVFAWAGLENMYPRPKWFPGARMNYSENMLALGPASRPDSIAVTVCQERGLQIEEYTFKQLETEVARWTNALRSMGIRIGDRIATVLPNTVDCLVLLLAAGAVGAIFSSTSPDMGTKGIVERYSQLKPKIFICYSEVSYGGKKIDLRPKLAEANRQLGRLVPELKHTVVAKGRLFEGHNVKSGHAVLLGMSTEPSYEQLPFDHPIYILYSSGTTGPPKCICHSAGGALLQNKKELILSYDLGINSVFYQYTTRLTQHAVVMGSPMANIYISEISTASLGIKVEIWDQDGKNIGDSGKEGDLIITKPFFSMPLTFCRPGGGEKYRKAYFEQFPGVWCI